MCIVRAKETSVNPLNGITGTRATAVIPRPLNPEPIPRAPVDMERLRRILSNIDLGTSPRTFYRHNFSPDDSVQCVHLFQEGASPNTPFTYPNTIIGRYLHRQHCPCSLQPKVESKKRTSPVMFTARTILIISFTLVVAKLVSDLVMSADALSTDRPAAVAVSTEKPAAVAVSTEKPAAVNNVYTPTLKKPVQEGQCTGRVKRQLPPLEQGNQVIDSIFQIPISTLNAVGSFIKNARPFVRRTRERIQQYYIQQHPNIAYQQQLQQQQHFYNRKPTSEEEPMYGYSDQPFIMFHNSKKNKVQKQRDDLQIEGRLHRHEYIDGY